MLSLTPLFPKLALLLITATISSESLLALDSQHIFLLTNGKNHTEIPFSLVNNLIVVEVVIGRKPMNFILDNGTSNPVIFHKKYLKELAVTLGHEITFQGVGAKRSVQATTFYGPSLHLSGVATDRIGMVVLKKNPFAQLKGKKTIHGVLGSTLFRSFIVEIDYPNQTLRLHQQATFLAPDHYQSVPMKVVAGRPYISALVQGKLSVTEMDLLLDLGFNNSLLLQLGDSMAKKKFTKSVTTRIGAGYGGSLIGRKGTIPSVLIGSNYYENVATIVPVSQSISWKKIGSGIQRMGSVGNTMFKDTSIIINYPEEKFYAACPESLRMN